MILVSIEILGIGKAHQRTDVIKLIAYIPTVYINTAGPRGAGHLETGANRRDRRPNPEPDMCQRHRDL